MNQPKLFVLVSLIFTLSACANINSIHHKYDFDGNEKKQAIAISIDAQQRFLNMFFDGSAWKACAEPSPDALAAFSSALGGSMTTPKDVAASVSSSIAEQAAAFGLRTQTITILRDEAYRICEAATNGSIAQTQVELLHRRFLNVLVATLAIEQLTGYARPTITTLGGGGSATSAGAALPVIQAQLKAATDKLSKDKDAQTKAQSDYDKEKTTDGATPSSDQQKALDSLKATLDDAANTVVTDKANVDSLTTALSNAQANSSNAFSNNAIIVSPQTSAQATAEIATAVTNIVKEVLHVDYTEDSCVSFLISNDAKDKTNFGDVINYCNTRLSSETGKLQNTANEKAQNKLKEQLKTLNLPKDKVQKLQEQLQLE
jgi:phosphohistidine phosphatase SixA